MRSERTVGPGRSAVRCRQRTAGQGRRAGGANSFMPDAVEGTLVGAGRARGEANRLDRVFGAPARRWREERRARALMRRVGAGVIALQVFVEPAEDVLQAFDAVPGLAGARELVRFA